MMMVLLLLHKTNKEILVPLFDELRAKYNHSQFQSIKEICLTSQGICMLQGPPGTGKTHTLLGLLSGLYYYIKKNPDSTKPKIMICAPSNTAVDEIVSRIVESGLHQPGGKTIRINVVRIGAIDYVPKDNVKRASLEYQIEKKLREKGLQQQQSAFPGTKTAQQHEQETLIDMRIDVARVNQEIEKAKKELVANELKEMLNHLFTKKRTLKAKIAVQKLEKVARRDQIKQISDQILGMADVVCCTLTSSLSEKLERFKDQIEVLIVDEAAQVPRNQNEPNNIIPLFYQPNKMVLIGDPKQLPATTFQPDSNITKYNRSLFERIIDNTIKPYFLDEQYRMHPNIRAFPSSAFYDNKLRDGAYVLTREFPGYVAPMERHNVQFIDITFSRERFSNKSYENDAEAEAAMHICTAVFARLRDSEAPSIGIITPYKQQTKLINDLIRRTIEKQFWKYIQVNTVDSFQGQEKDVIIFTTVRACHPNDKFRERMIGFLQDERRMNVALTRARFCLFVLGHADTLNSNQIWGNYVDSMAASKRYGKLDRREELREIGEYIVKGSLIQENRASSVYVKKDWGDEYRLAQLEKEQVNELKLTDFEEAVAQNNNNNSNVIDIDDYGNQIDIEDDGRDHNQNRDCMIIAEEDVERVTIKRSGVSMQEAIEKAQEEQVMRLFGSGIGGLQSLLNLSKLQSPPQQSKASSGPTQQDGETGSVVMLSRSEYHSGQKSASSSSRLGEFNHPSSGQKSTSRLFMNDVALANDKEAQQQQESIDLEIDYSGGSGAIVPFVKVSSMTSQSDSAKKKYSPNTDKLNGSNQKQNDGSTAGSSAMNSTNNHNAVTATTAPSGGISSSSQSANSGTNSTKSFDIYDQMRQQKQMSLKAKKAKIAANSAEKERDGNSNQKDKGKLMKDNKERHGNSASTEAQVLTISSTHSSANATSTASGTVTPFSTQLAEDKQQYQDDSSNDCSSFNLLSSLVSASKTKETSTPRTTTAAATTPQPSSSQNSLSSLVTSLSKQKDKLNQLANAMITTPLQPESTSATTSSSTFTYSKLPPSVYDTIHKQRMFTNNNNPSQNHSNSTHNNSYHNNLQGKEKQSHQQSQPQQQKHQNNNNNNNSGQKPQSTAITSKSATSATPSAATAANQQLHLLMQQPQQVSKPISGQAWQQGQQQQNKEIVNSKKTTTSALLNSIYFQKKP